MAKELQQKETASKSVNQTGGKNGKSLSPPTYGVVMPGTLSIQRKKKEDDDLKKKKPLQRKAKEEDWKKLVQHKKKDEDDLKKKKPIQRKANPGDSDILIDSPDSPLEKEADAVAEQVVRRMSAPADEKPAPLATSGISRSAAGSAGGSLYAPAHVASTLETSKGQGQPLPNPLRTEMEGVIGSDLSGVRIHTDAKAVELSEAVNAQAFTYGQDIYFNHGKYQPGSMEGRRLLGHEVGHVEQRAGFETPYKISNNLLSRQSIEFGGKIAITKLSPMEMINQILNQRAFTHTGPPQPLDTKFGPELGDPYYLDTHAFVQVTDSKGNVVAHETGAHLRTGSDIERTARGDVPRIPGEKGKVHAEAMDIGALERRLDKIDIRGGTLEIAVDQIPCPPEKKDCMGKLINFCQKKELNLKIYLPKDPEGRFTYKGTARRAFSGKIEGPIKIETIEIPLKSSTTSHLNYPINSTQPTLKGQVSAGASKAKEPVPTGLKGKPSAIPKTSSPPPQAPKMAVTPELQVPTPLESSISKPMAEALNKESKVSGVLKVGGKITSKVVLPILLEFYTSVILPYVEEYQIQSLHRDFNSLLPEIRGRLEGFKKEAEKMLSAAWVQFSIQVQYGYFYRKDYNEYPTVGPMYDITYQGTSIKDIQLYWYLPLKESIDEIRYEIVEKTEPMEEILSFKSIKNFTLKCPYWMFYELLSQQNLDTTSMMDEDEIISYIKANKNNINKLRMIPANEKLRLINYLILGWIGEEEFGAISTICDSVDNISEALMIRDEAEKKYKKQYLYPSTAYWGLTASDEVKLIYIFSNMIKKCKK